MRYYGRRRETIKNTIYIIIGLISLCFVSVKLQSLNIDEKIVVTNEEVEGQVGMESEQDLVLDVDKIYQWSNKPLDETQLSALLSAYLPGGGYLEKVSMDLIQESYCLKLTYIYNQYEQALSKIKRNQIALINASTLMSLYPNIDAVQINILIDGQVYRSVLYRPDLENYFGISLLENEGKRTFERIVKEFIQKEKVSTYWEEKHPYDSLMGEDVEAFYKMNFPVRDSEDEIFPYIDEDLDHAVVNQYGYKLFLQGLRYKNPLMNYYSAYRLIEYYENQNKEEIMLELATCQSKSQDERVQIACEKVIDLLSLLEEDEIRVFGRFEENVLDGGKKIYKIDKNGLSILAKWAGQNEAGLKIVSIAGNKEYALCSATSSERCYYYLLPTTHTYEIKEDGVYYNQSKIQTELISNIGQLIGEQEISEALEKNQIEWNWYFDSLIKVNIGKDIEFINDAKKEILQTKEQFNQTFDMKYLETYFKEKYEVSVEKSAAAIGTKAEVNHFIIDNEKVVVYEYAHLAQKNIELLQQEQESERQTGRVWSKGKLRVYYRGVNNTLITQLNHIMGKCMLA